ncbi:MAG: 4Fe-4S dicluster domain-containing protein [Bacteroidales bacterium]|nr:4Fe-4S dicluster domain-containing protein [Bacteroidales bacterium]HOK98516.1 4Fe-4S dicluster domain-containing protein [Bacteroidales bacterium]HPO65491.1 4Fe-4S dicluster domain-containing protein [Bacteroidales bacterium]
MPDFGFSIQSSQPIDLDKTYRAVYNFVKEKEPSIQRCIYCGACGATCTAANFSQMSLRKVNLLLLRGQIAEVRQLVEHCLLCGKCMLVCPRNVNTRKMILLIHQALKMPLS